LFVQAQGHDSPSDAIVSVNPHNQLFSVAVQLGLAGAAVLCSMWLAHLLLFQMPGAIARIGLLIVAQNVVSSLFNSHVTDFTQGWTYVFGVGVLGGMVLREFEAPTNLRASID
jgi:hypothetical protein